MWINDTAEEHHATMVSKIAEQSQPGVTHPLSEEQISREVLGMRSVYLKGYGIRKDSTSSSTHFEAPNSEVIVLQQQLVDQGKQLLDQAQTMSTMQTVIQMLTTKKWDRSSKHSGVSSKQQCRGGCIGCKGGRNFSQLK